MAGHRVGAQTLSAVLALASKPGGTLLEDLRHPVQRLDIVDERRTVEDADLGHIRRAVAGKAALAFDALDHRAFFAADVGASAATDVDPRVRRQARHLDLGNLLGQDRQHGGVFVAHVNVDVGCLDRPSRDQHPLKELMRIGFQIVAVLERARLALVAVDGHQPRTGRLPHEAPLATGREAGAAKATQPTVG